MGIETVVSLCIVILVFMTMIGLRFKNKNVEGSATNIIIVTGICCTFFGISLGLFNLDTNNIESNLEDLIDGIKTAFIPSAVAITLALFWKIFSLFSAVFVKQSEVATDCSFDDIVAQQNEIQKLLHILLNSKDSLLLESLDAIRKETAVGFRDMGDKFEKFAEKIASDNSQALIDALQEVIRDFNAKINEQFGENFKHLNEAVGRLLDWQDQYANELDRKIHFFNSLQATLEELSTNYNQIIENSKEFEKCARSLQEINEHNLSQQEYLSDNLEQLSKLCFALQRDIPNIANQLQEMGKASKNFLNQVEETHTSLIQDFNSFHEKITDSLEKNITGISEKIGNQAEALHKNLESALQDSLNSLGSQLASLSTKFVNDYTPLTEQLRRVVEISKGIK